MSLSPLLAIAIALAAGLAGAALATLVGRRLAAVELERSRADAAAARERDTAAIRSSLARAEAEREASVRAANELRMRLTESDTRAAALDASLRASREEAARRATEEATFAARIEELSRQQQAFKDTFRAMSAEALAQSGEAFLGLARREMDAMRVASTSDLERRERSIEAMLVPIRDGLATYDAKLVEIERQRIETFSQLAERLDGVVKTSDGLRGETHNLMRALRASHVRGRWGEVQLKRVCELAGMLEHCDFTTQETVGSEGARLRPDLVVHLVGGSSIVVDAKAPLEAYIEASAASDDETRRRGMERHAKQVRAHVDALARKSYWEQFANAPELVVLFLPGESFYSAALECDPTLIDHAVEQRVLIATPTTLIALLKALAYGWRQQRLAESARAISDLGRELHRRMTTMTEHFADVGSHLTKAVGAYNRTVGSLESRVLVTARRFTEMGAVASEEIPIVAPVETNVRELGALGDGGGAR